MKPSWNLIFCKETGLIYPDSSTIESAYFQPKKHTKENNKSPLQLSGHCALVNLQQRSCSNTDELKNSKILGILTIRLTRKNSNLHRSVPKNLLIIRHHPRNPAPKRRPQERLPLIRIPNIERLPRPFELECIRWDAEDLIDDGSSRFVDDVIFDDVAEIVCELAGFLGPEEPHDVGPSIHSWDHAAQLLRRGAWLSHLFKGGVYVCLGTDDRVRDDGAVGGNVGLEVLPSGLVL